MIFWYLNVWYIQTSNDVLQVRMSWCLIVDKVSGLERDVNQVFVRIGGRMTDEEANAFEGFVTMTDVKVCSLHDYYQMAKLVGYIQ